MRYSNNLIIGYWFWGEVDCKKKEQEKRKEKKTKIILQFLIHYHTSKINIQGFTLYEMYQLYSVDDQFLLLTRNT